VGGKKSVYLQSAQRQAAGGPYGWVYLIQSLINGKGYVGQTLGSPRRRLREHRATSRMLAAGRAPRNIVQLITEDMVRHGPEAFDVKAFWPAWNAEELDRLERQKIEECRTLVPDGYNLETGGRRGPGRAPHVGVCIAASAGHQARTARQRARGEARRAAGLPSRDKVKAYKTLYERVYRARQCHLKTAIPKSALQRVKGFMIMRLIGTMAPRYLPENERSRRQSEAQLGKSHPHKGVPWSDSCRLKQQAKATAQPRADGRFTKKERIT
jgi:hypothetical protein